MIQPFRFLDSLIRNMKIGTKFAIYYFILFASSILCSSLILQTVNNRILESKIGSISQQTLNTISSTIDSTIYNVDNYSKMILSDKTIQSALSNSSDLPDIRYSQIIRTSLTLYMDSLSPISSIYIFDFSGNTYSVSKQSPRMQITSRFQDADWYPEIVSLKGKYALKLDSGGFFEQSYGNNYLSFIRLINSTQTAKPIGLLIINIPIEELQKTYSLQSNSYYDIAVFNKDGIIINFNNTDLSRNAIEEIMSANSGFMTIGNTKYLVSSLSGIGKHNWNYAAITSFNDMASEYTQITFIPFLIILCNSILIFICALFISQLVTKPVKALTKSMRSVEKGEFCKVDIKANTREISTLQLEYNTMVEEIQNLIDRVVKEQRVKRKAELNVLQEQIKPHFLYNSLDAIAYMITANKNNDAYSLVLVLSDYYRMSLSKGNEIVSLEQEIDLTKNYLIIQKVRFPDIFEDIYDIDEQSLDVKIPKLVLQPLVENAIYHGIRPKGEPGSIHISVKQQEANTVLVIEDDGVGMDQEQVDTLMSGNLEINMSSFGLRGTIERLKIYYGSEHIYKIESIKNQGTKITVIIPGKQV